MIQQIFSGDNGYFVGTIPPWNLGLTAAHWEDHHSHVEAFQKLITSWPTVSSHLMAASLTRESVEHDSTSAERAIAAFYCQLFFNHFARAAITPHRLSEPSLL